MVTAGVYMIGRNAVLFTHAPETLQVVAVIGAATALFAGTIGLVQTDIKRVLAYSTVSQLGYMFLAMGVGAFSAGIFHLYTHAFFKALLFLGSGAVIHALHGEQDLRHMGGLKKDLPITYWTFLIGAIAISGVPGLSGFFSKDEILGQTYATGHTTLWVIGVLTALLTATYMFRLVFLAFHGKRRQAHAAADAHGHAEHDDAHLHDAPPAMALALVVLAIGSVGAGYVGVPEALGGSNAIQRYLAPSFEAHVPKTEVRFGVVSDAGPAEAPAEAGASTVAGPEAHAAGEGGGLSEAALMSISILMAFAGIGVAWYFFLSNPKAAEAVAGSAAPVHDLLLHRVLRGRALRRGGRPADPGHLARRALEGRGRAGHRRNRQRRRGGRGRRREPVAARADRVGPGLRGVDHCWASCWCSATTSGASPRWQRSGT